MIEPVVRVALALHTNPGAYALLIGSGVSRPAGVPTGTEVALDLATKVAASQGEPIGDDVADWFQRKYGAPLGYTQLLGELASTGPERMRLLQTYFEPTPEEAEAGLKRPTRAHRAIAELVSDGAVRVIITTNFDRLIEAAVREVGIEPIVITAGDDVAGAPPPAQSRCFVVKAHGDYLDGRLRNNPTELAALDPQVEQLIRRVLDEYGLIVAGWSAEWDTGLRTMLNDAQTGRYGTYWVTRKELIGAAAEVAAARNSTVVRVRDADTFFSEVRQEVAALRDLAGSTALTPRLAVARAKRHLARPEDRIALHDLVMAEATQIRQRVRDLGTSATTAISYTDVSDRLTVLEQACSVLLPLVATVGYWGSGEHAALLRRVVSRLSDWPIEGGMTLWLRLRDYPASLAMYAAGTASVAAERFHVVARLLRLTTSSQGQAEPAARALAAGTVLERDTANGVASVDEGKPIKYYTPASDRLCRLLRDALSDLVPEERPFLAAFDRFEYLLSMRTAVEPDPLGTPWIPLGAFGWRNHRALVGGGIPAAVGAEIEVQKDQWAPVQAGIFDSSDEAVSAHEAVLARLARPGWD